MHYQVLILNGVSCFVFFPDLYSFLALSPLKFESLSLFPGFRLCIDPSSLGFLAPTARPSFEPYRIIQSPSIHLVVVAAESVLLFSPQAIRTALSSGIFHGLLLKEPGIGS